MNLEIMDTISLRKVIDTTLIWLKLISFRLILYSFILQKQPMFALKTMPFVQPMFALKTMPFVQPMFALKTMPFVTNLQDEDPFTLIVNVNVVMVLAEILNRSTPILE